MQASEDMKAYNIGKIDGRALAQMTRPHPARLKWSFLHGRAFFEAWNEEWGLK